MDADEFADGPGTIVEYDGLACYRPASLPPEIEYTDAILCVYGDAQYALGRLATLHRNVDNENLLIAPFVVREAAMSSQIEGTNVTVSDIILHDIDTSPRRSGGDSQDVTEAYNYVDAIQQGFDRIAAGEQLSVDLVCDLQETLLADGRGSEDRPGQLREVPVYIGAPDGSAESARFVPANPDTVDLLLEQLVSYMNAGSYPPLIDVAITHYQFETIHPFRDGNGRLGRLLMMLQLYDAGLLPEPYLYLSAYFNRHRQQYLDYLLAVSRDGAWEQWITFVLNAIAEQAIDAYECGVELQTLRREYHSRFPNRPAVRDVIDYVFEEPYLTATRAIEATGRSRQAVYDAIEALEAAGIVDEISDSERYRVYEAPEILRVVESP
ncbi:cell filamentation protein Fic [Halalkaliarchaeum desulfuricum]|uniref:Cell filamentation protein Fic n=1 Tax=Halalkaliarchaeum desulfuricum TaxID=2055893 RepID=A0A343TNB6_9EURY|nr:Fic/DOC family N-terminal domain-containing protein [Halalkaliarchaeum desulfuricum]AUX10588.1 cell filamentation protein Fic [Halalkaliarchaeum desulfuricum]